ncbi:MAG: glucuronokinase [Parasphingorhabdus sp.]|jgi:glucuronokinase
MPGNFVSQVIKTTGFPRAALVGNPSDGYFGKTIAFAFANFQTDLTLVTGTSQAELPKAFRRIGMQSIATLNAQTCNDGYDAQYKLVQATIKRFSGYCRVVNKPLFEGPLTIGYQSSIPYSVGLAGSSAIIIACYRALMALHQLIIPLPQLANEVFNVEFEELDIGGGLQDRVAQTLQGLVYMDFDRQLMESRGYGSYTHLDFDVLAFPYIAFKRDLAENSGILHNNLRQRWLSGDQEFIAGMQMCADAACQAKLAIQSGDSEHLSSIINLGFDRRIATIPGHSGNQQMIELARQVGACANQAGSGGSVVGSCRDEKMFDSLQQEFDAMGVEVIRPQLAPAVNGADGGC